MIRPTLALVTACLSMSIAAPAAADPVAQTPPPQGPIRSEGMRAAGIALTFAGSVGAATGGVLLLASSFGCPDRCEDSASRSRALGAPLLGVGVAALAAGVVLIVIGNQKAPVTAAPSQPPTAARLLPAWARGGFALTF